MAIRIRGALVLTSLVSGMLAGAPASAQSQSISLQVAIQIAMERNPTMRAARIDAMAGEVDVAEARMEFVPDLIAGATGTRDSGRSFNETEGHITEQTTDSLSVGVSSGLTLFRGFRNVANLGRANLSRRAGELALERTSETVVFTVASNFLTLLHWQEQARVQRENLAAEVELEQQLQNYVAAGARAAADLYQQQANVASARVDLIEAESSVQWSQVELIRTVQLDPAGTYDFQPLRARQIADEHLELHDLLARVFAKRTDLQAQQVRFEAAEQQLRMANSDYWPTLSLVAGYSSAYTDASELRFKDQIDARRGGAVSLHLTIPIFDRNLTRTASRRAQLQLLSEQVALDETRHQVGLQVRQAYQDYQTARKRFTAAEAQQQASSRALQTAQERYRSGASTLVELTQARSVYLDAEGGLAAARAVLDFQRTAIDYFMGDLEPNRFNPE